MNFVIVVASAKKQRSSLEHHEGAKENNGSPYWHAAMGDILRHILHQNFHLTYLMRAMLFDILVLFHMIFLFFNSILFGWVSTFLWVLGCLGLVKRQKSPRFSGLEHGRYLDEQLADRHSGIWCLGNPELVPGLLGLVVGWVDFDKKMRPPHNAKKVPWTGRYHGMLGIMECKMVASTWWIDRYSCVIECHQRISWGLTWQFQGNLGWRIMNWL